jgi:hypothetical protein
MKVFELIFNEDKHLIDRVSIVKGGAVEADRVFFTEEKDAPLFFANEEKRVIYSVAMRPNKMIFRSNVSSVVGVVEPANVFYTPETVEKLQQFYFKNQNNSKTNINHETENVEGVYPFESWIVQNAEIDKSKSIGLETKAGDWVMGFKVDNQKVWDDVKKGDLDGLSIEAYLGFKEVNNTNTNTQMNTQKTPQNLWDTMRAFFAADLSEEEKAKAEAEAAAAEAPAVEDAPKEEEVKAEAEAVVAKDPIADIEAEDTATPEAESEDIQAKYDVLLEENAKLKADLATIEAEKVKAEADLVTMSKQTPAAESIKDLPKEVKMTAEETALYKFKRQHGIN